MAGIIRIRIESDWHDWRTEMAEALADPANEIYRHIFSNLGMPLKPGCEIVRCTKQEAEARYDWREGIDVIFMFQSGTRATAQEKFLAYDKSTVTFEERKTSGAPGAWYYCTAQYYFVGYARQWCIWNEPEEHWPKVPEFHDWILVDLPAFHRAEAVGLVSWNYNRNRRDGRRSLFRYVHFNAVPKYCIVARYDPVQITFPF